MFSSQYSAASRAKRSARSSSTPDGGALRPASSPNTSAKIAPRSTAAPVDCATWPAACRCWPSASSAEPRGGDAEIDVAQRGVGDLQRGHQLAEQLLLDAGREPAQHGVHQVALLGARIAVGGAVEAGQAVDQAADLDLELAAHLGALDRRVAHRDQALHQIGDAAVIGPEGLVPGARRIGEVALHVEVVDEVAAQLDGALRRRPRRCPVSRPPS